MAKAAKYLWNEIWSRHWYANERRRTRRASQKFSAVRALLGPTGRLDSYAAEIGCGSGHFLKHAVQSTMAQNYIGCDFSISALNLAARTLSMEQNYSLVGGDAAQTPFRDKTFDFLFLVCVIEHIEKKETALSEAKRVLRNDGKLIIFYSNSRSAFAWQRFLKSKFQTWQFGYQDEMNVDSLSKLLQVHSFRMIEHGVVQGDWDFPLLAFVDLFINFFDVTWARYNFAIAETTND